MSSNQQNFSDKGIAMDGAPLKPLNESAPQPALRTPKTPQNQKNRSMKVHAQSGYNYKATPTIILKGQWLQEMGFEIGDYISVSCEDGKLIITPDAEKAAIAKAEAEFMEKEVKKLQKKFQKEKEMIHAQFVAEQAPQYAAEREVQ